MTNTGCEGQMASSAVVAVIVIVVVILLLAVTAAVFCYVWRRQGKR